MVLTTPMFTAIKRRYPEVELHVLASPKSFAVVQDDPRIDRIFLYEKKLVSLLSLVYRLRRERYDYWIDPKDHRSREGALLARLSDARTKIGWNPVAGKVFDVGIPSDKENFSLHAIERNIQALFALDIKSIEKSDLRLYCNAEADSYVLEQIKGIAKRKAIINISAGDDSRRWSIEKWRGVCSFCESADFSPIITFHPHDEEAAKSIHDGCNDSTLFYSRTIKDIVGLMKHAQLVISPDTSIIHIAGAFNIPTVGLYPRVEWNLNKFKPSSDLYEVVLPDEGRSFDDITLESVSSKIEMILATMR